MNGNFKRGEKVRFWDSSANEYLYGTIAGRIRPGINSYRVKNVCGMCNGELYQISKESVIDDTAARAMARYFTNYPTVKAEEIIKKMGVAI